MLSQLLHLSRWLLVPRLGWGADGLVRSKHRGWARAGAVLGWAAGCSASHLRPFQPWWLSQCFEIVNLSEAPKMPLNLPSSWLRTSLLGGTVSRQLRAPSLGLGASFSAWLGGTAILWGRQARRVLSMLRGFYAERCPSARLCSAVVSCLFSGTSLVSGVCHISSHLGE